MDHSMLLQAISPHFASKEEKVTRKFALALTASVLALCARGSPDPCVLLPFPSLQDMQRVSWYLLPCTLVTFPCCSQSWCGWHGLVLELEEKKPWGQSWHWVSSKGVPVHGETRGLSGDKLAQGQRQQLGMMPDTI